MKNSKIIKVSGLNQDEQFGMLLEIFQVRYLFRLWKIQ